MSITTVCIIGNGDMGLRLQELLSKGDFRIMTSRLEEDYAEQASSADLVLEVAPEEMALKMEVLKDCDTRCRKETVLATTTANSWVTKLAAATGRPEKVIGLNFTKNPFEEKYLVQIVKGLQTSDDTVQASKEFLEKAGVSVARLEETPGFILDRVIASVVNEAAVMYSAKLATIEDIDRMMKVCVNWPMGPFEFADSIGIDRIVETLDSLSQQLGPKYLPCFLLRKMVHAGWLGKKTGRGFYNYAK
ncbi:MAG TPA: 3-hydroxybutyryl-CoA dehydrogenase [Dehalococcoidia bacterium]|nr:3-hydroxybutyryl-CoA dehydrogenase [Dehalococcoidia bacterium]